MRNPPDRARQGYGEVSDIDVNGVVAGAHDVEMGKSALQPVVRSGMSKDPSPDNAGSATNRVPIVAAGEAQERYGARYRTQMPQPTDRPLAPTAPEAALTQANGLIIRSAVRRDRENFWAGHYDGGGTWG